MVNLCLNAMQDPNPQVVQISYFALCQFSENFLPSLPQYNDRIMTLLIESIDSKEELQTVSRYTFRFYDALQAFCENLGEDLQPYLPTLMAKLIRLETQINFSYELQYLIVSTFSSIVNSVKSSIITYFDFVLQIIKPHLLYYDFESYRAKELHIASMILMGMCAKNFSHDNLDDQLIQECLRVVQDVLTDETDPEIRSAAFDMLSGLTTKLKGHLELHQIMPQLIETLNSEQGLNVVDSDEIINDITSIFNHEDDAKYKDDEDDAYLNEKLSALACLYEISEHDNPQLIVFFENILDTLIRLRDNEDPELQTEAQHCLINLLLFLRGHYIAFLRNRYYIVFIFSYNYLNF